jgi:hypothetical protein
VPANGAVGLNWNAPNFILQTNADLTNPAGWGDVPDASNSPATINLGGDRQFFRLRHE